MIACGYCGKWYHGNCVGITPEKAEQISAYRSLACTMEGVLIPFYTDGLFYRCQTAIYFAKLLDMPEGQNAAMKSLNKWNI